jgi:hypothetical protein
MPVNPRRTRAVRRSGRHPNRLLWFADHAGVGLPGAATVHEPAATRIRDVTDNVHRHGPETDHYPEEDRPSGNDEPNLSPSRRPIQRYPPPATIYQRPSEAGTRAEPPLHYWAELPKKETSSCNIDTPRRYSTRARYGAVLSVWMSWADVAHARGRDAFGNLAPTLTMFQSLTHLLATRPHDRGTPAPIAAEHSRRRPAASSRSAAASRYFLSHHGARYWSQASQGGQG